MLAVAVLAATQPTGLASPGGGLAGPLTVAGVTGGVPVANGAMGASQPVVGSDGPAPRLAASGEGAPAASVRSAGSHAGPGSRANAARSSGLPASLAPLPASTPPDLARAPLAKVESSITALDQHMALVTARVEATRQELAVAEIDRARLDATVVATQARIGQLRREVAEQAIATYIQPRPQLLEVFLGQRDIDASARRQGLLHTLIETNEQAVDQLQQVRQDLLALRLTLEEADQQAAQMRQVLDQGGRTLTQASLARAAVAATLADRVNRLDGEILGHQQAEPALLRVLSKADLAAEAAVVVAAQKSERRMRAPIEAEITSEFGPRWGRMHSGVDFESDHGVAIVAARGGVVLEADWMDGYGLSVVIDHGGGLSTLYAHQSELDVTAGQRIERGERLGWVGVTGNSSGPHLHFEVRLYGAAVDPRNYLA